MQKLALLLCLLMLACSHKNPKTAGSGELKIPEFPVTSFTLSNGLRVLLIEKHNLPIFSLYTFYRVGGKNEVKGITGASHFLEHMMFKGAKKYGAGQFDFLIEGNGGQNNAFTTNDQTVYYESLPNSTLELTLDIEADRMVNLLLKKEDFESERHVVLEERKLRYENSPRGQVYLKLMEQMFQGTPYGTSVIGDIQDIETVTRDQIQEYFQRFYAPNNAVLVLAGDFDVAVAKKLIEEKFGPLASSPKVAESHQSLKDEDFALRLKTPERHFLHGSSNSPLFMLAYPGTPLGSKESFAFDMLSTLLGETKSSYLQQKFLYATKPKVSSVYASHYTLEKSGMFMFGGELVKGEDPVLFEKKLKKALSKSCSQAITDEALQKVKNQYWVALYGELDTNSGLAQFLGERESHFGNYKEYLNEFAAYQALGVIELREACTKLVNDPRTVYAVVWDKFPVKSKSKSARAKR